MSFTLLLEDVRSILNPTPSLSRRICLLETTFSLHGPGSTIRAIGMRLPSLVIQILICSEFYMNCAPVVVVGTAGSSFTGPRIFEANIFGQGKCNTVEGVDVVYPNPGSSVHFGGSFVGGNTGPATELANCDFDQNVMLTTTGGSASASAGNSTASGSSTSGNTTDVPPNSGTQPFSRPHSDNRSYSISNSFRRCRVCVTCHGCSHSSYNRCKSRPNTNHTRNTNPRSPCLNIHSRRSQRKQRLRRQCKQRFRSSRRILFPRRCHRLRFGRPSLLHVR